MTKCHHFELVKHQEIFNKEFLNLFHNYKKLYMIIIGLLLVHKQHSKMFCLVFIKCM